MDRREILKTMAMTLGGSIALPGSVFARMGEPVEKSQLTLFTPAQRAQVAALAEAMIPETDTPGAIEAGVPEWMEVILKDCYLEEDRTVILAGLEDCTQHCRKRFGKTIEQLPAGDQVSFMTELHKEQMDAYYASINSGGEPRKPFLSQFRELAKFTYVNSEVGGTTAFEYVHVPTRWEPAKKLTPDQKPFVL